MPDHEEHNHRDTELDPKLLNTPYKVHTNWHIITGAPSCGKTTLINLLAQQGYQVVPEGARIYLEQEVAKGRSMDDIRSNEHDLQRCIMEMHAEIERGLAADAFMFLDRAVPDCLPWHRIFGVDPNSMLLECFKRRYASVFILDQLPVELDGYRYEGASGDYFDMWHTRDYAALGYTLVRVPVVPPEDRVAFVLNSLLQRGLLDTI